MPSIIAQKPTTKLPTPISKSKGGAENLLDRVQPVETATRDFLKASIYGRAKTGKTRLICSCPGPVLLIGAEDGTQSIRKMQGVDFVKLVLDSYKPQKGDSTAFIRLGELEAFLEQLRKANKYASYGLDTVSSLADLLLCDVLGLDRIPEQKHWGLAQREDYMQQGVKLKKIVRDILDLPGHVIVTAHERDFNEEQNVSPELLQPHIGSALSEKQTQWLNGQVDYILQTFIKAEVEEKEEKVTIAGKLKVTKKLVRTGKMLYCLRIGPHETYQTGFRQPDPTKDDTLPPFIINPTFDKIQSVIDGTYEG